MKLSICAAIGLLSFSSLALSQDYYAQTSIIIPSGAGPVTFTALHTFFMAPDTGSVPTGWANGNDSNNGTSQLTPWASNNHSVVCGDVIVAAPGSYANLQAPGTVSNCPSTSGGIDGNGGVYFATMLCGGASVGDCFITTRANTTGNTIAMYLDSNWAVEGWYVNTSAKGRAYESLNCNTTGSANHHVAVINDISANNLETFDTDDCGVTGAKSTDYAAVVGAISQNSGQDTTCNAAIDIVGPGVFDALAGTHFFLYGNFSYDTHGPCGGTGGTDVEDYMFDTWDFHGVNSQGVIANNIGFDADRMCVNLFTQSTNSTSVMKVYNNSCYRDNVNSGNASQNNLWGEFNTTSAGNNITYKITLTNNLAYQPLADFTVGNTGRVAAFMLGFSISTFTNGGTGAENYFRANNTSCTLGFCNSTFDAQVATQGTSANLGTNIYTNPAYTNTTDLLTRGTVVPNCSGFTSTTACMGWNAITSTMTTPSIISDLVPTASGISNNQNPTSGASAGKGYQLPSTTCAANSDYPTWLKGIVYLHWTGSGLTENADLVTKPCGM